MKTIITSIALCFWGLAANAQSAKIQFINNTADQTLKEIDIYLNDDIIVDDLKFRTATPFKQIDSGREISLKVGESDTHCSGCTKYDLKLNIEAGKTYVIVANGMMDKEGYNPAQPFALDVYKSGKETSGNANTTSVLVHHGSSDAPTVDINNVTDNTSSVLVDNIDYKGFSGYKELPVKDYQINVSTADGSKVLKTYDASLAKLALGGKAITIVANGFINPKNNNGGAAFGLWAATANGGDLIQLPESNLSTSSFELSKFKLYPNPASNNFIISNENFKDTKAKLFDVFGRVIQEFSLKEKHTRVNIKNLQPNVYFIKLYKNGISSKSIKLIIE